MKIHSLPVTYNLKPLDVPGHAITKNKKMPENIKNGEDLVKSLRQKSGAPDPQKQLELQEQWKAHSVIRINGKISVINYQNAGVETHGAGTGVTSIINSTIQEAEKQGLHGQELDNVLTDRIVDALKKRYGQSVSVEKFNGANAPTAGELQIEMYGKKYTDSHPHTNNEFSNAGRIKSIKPPLIDMETYLALYDKSITN